MECWVGKRNYGVAGLNFLANQYAHILFGRDSVRGQPSMMVAAKSYVGAMSYNVAYLPAQMPAGMMSKKVVKDSCVKRYPTSGLAFLG